MISPGMFLEIIRIFFCSEKSLEFLENLNFSKCSTKYVIPGEISSQKFEDSVRGFFFQKFLFILPLEIRFLGTSRRFSQQFL